MKFNKIMKELSERTIPVSGATRQGKKLLMRGISIILLDEGEPQDVHGIPQGLEAYGRGWADKSGTITVDGGAQGSAQGHPSWAVNGFYYGSDYDKKVLYLRGRASTAAEFLEDNLLTIIDLIFPRLPR